MRYSARARVGLKMPPRTPIPIIEAAGLDPDISDMAVVEALLDQLVRQDDVWEYVDRIENRYKVPPEQRQRFYEQFVAMVALRPQAEQDALVSRGQLVFKYRLETARRDVQALRSEGASGAIKIAPSVFDDVLMAEIIHCPNDPKPVKFLVYKAADGTTEVAERV